MALQIDKMCDRCRGPCILTTPSIESRFAVADRYFQRMKSDSMTAGLVRLRSGRANTFAADLILFLFYYFSWNVWVALKRAGGCCFHKLITYAFFEVFFGRSTAWMFGSTPPWAMVTPPKSLLSSSSFLMASCKCLGMILVFLLSRAALPANSRTSALRYSKTAARYTGAPAPTRSE